MPSTAEAIYAFFTALVVVWLATPLVGRLARRFGVIDYPRARGLSERPTPRLGGLAIFLGVLVAGILWLPDNAETRGILVGAALITLVGVADDKWDLHPAVKLLGQTVAALVPVLSGVNVDNFTLPFLGRVDLGWAGYPATTLGIVAVMNAVNFIDGADGLAAGVCTIAAATLAVIALSLDRDAAGVLALLTAGAALGFLWHSFHPASIFLGDSGSNLLGFLLATIAVQGSLKTNAVVALVFPLVILAVPILDSGFVIAKRIKYGHPVYVGDSWHFHHRFANIGFSQRRTVVYIWGWTLSLAALALALRFVPYSDDHGHFNTGWTLVMVGFGLVAVAASVYLVLVLEILKFKRFRGITMLRERLQRGEPEPGQAEVEEEVAHELETGDFEAVEAD